MLAAFVSAAIVGRVGESDARCRVILDILFAKAIGLKPHTNPARIASLLPQLDRGTGSEGRYHRVQAVVVIAGGAKASTGDDLLVGFLAA